MTRWVPTTKTASITKATKAVTIATMTMFVRAREFGIAYRSCRIEPARRGKSAIKRAAIAPGSGDADAPSGSVAINDANLSIAVCPGNRANTAASFQGSKPSRASAETTLSNVPFLSSPIGANRNFVELNVA